MKTLRFRLILSHILPLVVTVPLIGLVLTYILQTQILLANLTREIQTQAVLLVEMTSQQVNIWADTRNAQAFVTRISPELNAQVALLDAQGDLLASSDPAEMSHVGQKLNLAGIADALRGETQLNVQQNLLSATDVIQMLVPVVDPNQHLMGVIRLNLPVANLRDRVYSMRTWVAWILGGGLLLGGLLGWWLALNLERPLRQTTNAIVDLTSGERSQALVETGPRELRLLIRAFNALSDRLKLLEENRRRLLANLVHELGRPLGALHSAIEALRNGADQQEELRQDLLAGMDGEIHRLETLLNDLALLHGQVIGSLELTKTRFEPRAWLSELLPSWREAATAKGIRWEEQIPGSLPEVIADSGRLAQAVGNLISNAIKYTPAGGLITIAAGNTPGEIWLKVSDTGLGIAPSEQQEIFTAFYRSPTVRRFPQGMGLGLTIADDLARAHGGRIEVSSALGVGSTFTLHVPTGTD